MTHVRTHKIYGRELRRENKTRWLLSIRCLRCRVARSANSSRVRPLRRIFTKVEKQNAIALINREFVLHKAFARASFPHRQNPRVVSHGKNSRRSPRLNRLIRFGSDIGWNYPEIGHGRDAMQIVTRLHREFMLTRVRSRVDLASRFWISVCRFNETSTRVFDHKGRHSACYVVIIGFPCDYSSARRRESIIL